MTKPRSYPAGVTSWVDIAHEDVGGASAFYGELLGWTFTEDPLPGDADRYLIAQLDGLDAAGVLGTRAHPRSSGWNTYIAVDDVEAAVARVEAGGGHVVTSASQAGMGGKSAACADPYGVVFGLWHAGARPGAQAVNAPGGWNFSDLHAADPEASAAWYGEVFGWSVDDLGFGRMIRRPGYGDHLASTSDPEIYQRQAGVSAPPGFADAIGWMAPVLPDEEPHWHVTFTVADRDATAASVERLGGTVLGTSNSDWTREVLVRDPQGAVFTACQFAPPGT
ncbi:MAG: VOC family protein [Nocardioides sp.]